ncbi:hypothetical protein PG997_012233 [Apiospora hydei]|uniref:Uncharacterized protein n=1 Tax=Apiospora hydei TaxID=1337664 RepID=A0ABR1V2R7_9PEZI
MAGGVSTACSPVSLAAVAPHDADYAYIQSNGNPVHIQAMTACCAPQEARQVDNGCYTWCRLAADADIDAPESQVSWEKDFQYCLNYQGRLLASGSDDGGGDDGDGEGEGEGGGGEGRYRAPWVHAVKKGTPENALVSAAASNTRRHDGEVGGLCQEGGARGNGGSGLGSCVNFGRVILLEEGTLYAHSIPWRGVRGLLADEKCRVQRTLEGFLDDLGVIAILQLQTRSSACAI